MIEEIGDTGKAKIDRTLSNLPPDFPAAMASSISEGARRRIDTLMTTWHVQPPTLAGMPTR
jgi:hypothetical protein